MSYTARLAAFTAAIALAAPAAGDATPAHGASFTVNATHDAVDASPGDSVCADAGGACTLRAAVMETNALPGADEISLPAGTYVNSEGMAITESLTITGAGASSTIVQGTTRIGGGMGTRCGLPQYSVTITGISIRESDGIGNCDQFLTLSRVTLAENGHGGLEKGGAIYNAGYMTITDSTISDNSAAYGAAIYSDDTFSGNVSTLSVSNTTLSGNVPFTYIGGAIWVEYGRSNVDLTNVTISSPGLDAGPGFESTVGIAGVALLKNTIISVEGPGRACGGTFSSGGHNLVSDSTCGLAGPGDLNGVNPLLGPLANNGGPTLTHALLPGSPAIDAADNYGCPATDQRGVPRWQGAACDIGAYEYVPPPPPPPPEPAVETAAPTPEPVPAVTASPSPSPSASPVARRVKRTPSATPVALDVEEDGSGGGLPWVAGLATLGVLGVGGGAAGGGYYWYRLRRRGS